MVGRLGGSPAQQWINGKFIRMEHQRSVEYVRFEDVREGIGSIQEEEEGATSPLHMLARARDAPNHNPISCSPPIDIPMPTGRSPAPGARHREEQGVLDERFYSARSYVISGEESPLGDDGAGGDEDVVAGGAMGRDVGVMVWRDADSSAKGASTEEDDPGDVAAHRHSPGAEPQRGGAARGAAKDRGGGIRRREARTRPPQASVGSGRGSDASEDPAAPRVASVALNVGGGGNRNSELHESLIPQAERGGHRRDSNGSAGMRGSPVSSEDGMGSSQKGSSSSYRGEKRGGPLSRVGSSGSLSSWSRYLSPSRIVSYISNLPIQIRGRAEAWETSRDEIILLEEVGKGQTGVVHRCIWRRLECAAKILSPTQGCNTVEYQDMVNEISTVSHLRHPNLVLFLGACTQGDGPLLLLNEFMTGGSLEQRFSAKKREIGRPWRCPRTLAVKWLRDMSRAVHFLHQCCPPIIHRDLKPANILLTEQDVLKIGDFGLSKVIKKAGERSGAAYKMTGEAGTMRYMAPEVVRSEPYYDQKVDIYSMGMIFWYILTGERPFEGVRPAQIARQASNGHVRPPLDCVQWPQMEAVIQNMWSDSPDTRPSGGEILNEIEEVIANGCDKKGCFKNCIGL